MPRVEDGLIVKGVTADVKPYMAKPEIQAKLDFPETLVDNWEEAAVRKLGELLEKYKSLQVYLDTCVRCGSCTDKCQFFLGTGDPNNMPVARAELLRKIYKRYFTTEGKL
ncbi:MAG: sulfate reduction electron transfer complex DsrMKJOP subunit DsrK, partial [Thermoleophilia bacterium]